VKMIIHPKFVDRGKFGTSLGSTGFFFPFFVAEFPDVVPELPVKDSLVCDPWPFESVPFTAPSGGESRESPSRDRELVAIAGIQRLGR
jgi:hypothetical protein